MAVLDARCFRSAAPHAGKQRNLYSSTHGRKLKETDEEHYRYSAASYDRMLKDGTMRYRSLENQVFDPTREH